ncbi:putative molybdenum carrier protein [Paraburkholderia sediminicola]|uniref:Molybdenum carrier protein n=1 Tax=Paraburkholderia metrosideri TaxID=580937 RepID=A0ABW9DY07_9BURK
MAALLKRIVSGGQTGVDRGALDAALDMQFPCGGWCPAGRLAEDGSIPNRYPLTELPNAGYEERTLQNLLDSDGTVVIHFGVLSGGTLETCEWCVARGKPMKIIDAATMPQTTAAEEIGRFTERYNIETLNVAGPRTSKAPQAQQYTRDALTLMLERYVKPFLK